MLRPLLSTHEESRNDPGGLFALAIVAIIAFDCKAQWLSGGFTGVDVVLVLAGFLCCNQIPRSFRDGEAMLLDFYVKAIKWIVPQLLLVLIFAVALGLMVLSPWEVYRLGQSVVAAAVGGANFLFLVRGSFFAERAITNPLLMTWAVSLLMQFIFVLPLLLFLLKNRSRRTLVVVLAVISTLSFFLCVYFEFKQHIWNFYLPITRAWEFGAGSLLALWQPRDTLSADRKLFAEQAAGTCGIAMLLTTFVLYHPEMRFPGFEALLPVVGTLLLLSSPPSWINQILSGRAFAALGAVSYPLYLWHWVFLSFAAIASARPLHPATIGIVLTLTVLFALESYLLVERPILRRKPGGAAGTVGVYSVCMLVLAAAGGVLYVTKGLPSRSPALYGIESRAALYRHYPCISSGSYLRLSSECAPVPVASEPAMAVLGGGHAEAFAEGLRDYLRKNGWQLVTLTRESCPPTRGYTQWSPSDSTLTESCRTFNRSALNYVLSRPDIRTVILVGRWRAGLVPDTYSGDPAQQSAVQNAADLRLGLSDEVSALQAAGRHVIVVEDTPEFPDDPVAGVRSHYLKWRRALNDFFRSDLPDEGDGSSIARSMAVSMDADKANDQVLAVKATHAQVMLVDPKRIVCDANRCFFANDADLFFFDSVHLSRTGAMRILPLLPPLHTLR